MPRPCFLVVDREHSSSISSRKLVIETAKFNVITAYNGAEAIATAQRFPAVDAVILDSTLRDMEAEAVIVALKRAHPALPVILICAPHQQCAQADYHVDLFNIAGLLQLLQRLYPQATASIQSREKSLHQDEEG